MRRKRNPLFAKPELLSVEDEEIAGYKVEQIRSCKPEYTLVSWEDDDGEKQKKRFASKGKAIVWVGKQVKRKRTKKNPAKVISLNKFTRV